MDSKYGIAPREELYHWGIKGMKWGIRRYQNKDGSLTEAGKKRAASNDDTNKSKRVDDLSDQNTRAGKSLSRLGGKNETEVSERDRGNFMFDVRTVLTQTRPGDISSKNERDVKEFGRFLKECWEYEVSVANEELASGIPVRVGGDPLHEVVGKYYNTYVKNDPDAYAKSVLEEIEYRELHHSDINAYVFTDDDLYHWGIKGMKWGIRRYQNKDGSLTPAGKKRYAQLEAEMEKLGGKSNEKKLSEMTDEEVAAKTNRVRLENSLKEEMRKSAEAEQRQRKIQESMDETSTEELRNKVARLQLEEQYKNLKNPKKTERDPQMEKLQREVDRLTLEKRYRDLQKELNPKKKSFMETLGQKALNDVLVPSAMNAGKTYLDKMVKKYVAGNEPTMEDFLKKYGDMSDTDYERYKRAAAVKGWEKTILGKNNNDK